VQPTSVKIEDITLQVGVVPEIAVRIGVAGILGGYGFCPGDELQTIG
jgi:hypothetical protein